MRYLNLLPAIILDFLQMVFLIVFIVMQFITPVGGGVTGALAAGTYCWSTSSGIISGITSFVSCAAAGGIVGAGVSAFATPIGVAVDVMLSLTLGAGILVLLAFQGMFYPSIIMRGFVAELMPFWNFLPMWTTTTWRCIKEKENREAAPESGVAGKALGAVAGMAALAVPGGSVARTMLGRATRQFAAAGQALESKPREERRASLLPNRFADITPRKPANDNNPQSYAQAA